MIYDPVTLPLLNDEELRHIFGDDEAAMRRYHMLAAVIHEGASADQASGRYASSPRTVRHLLQRYRVHPGLDTLRSGRPGPRGHRRSDSLVAQVVGEVYAGAPQASGGTLLALVNRRLAQNNLRVSRATFYRLIAALKDDTGALERGDVRAPLRGALSAALPLLTEDPPITLGTSLLARMLTPPLPEGMAPERGQVLARVLTQIIADMQPGAGVSAADPRARAYAILAGEFISGDAPEAVQERLAISPRTYYRAKRQSLDRLAELLPPALATLTPALPRTADPIPRVEPFFGRDDELAYYEWRLRSESMAVIWGLAGSGKTALAARLAVNGQRLGQAVIWHTLSAETSTLVRDALSALAGGLLEVGGLDMVDAVRRWQQESATLPRDQQIARLVALLARRHCVVMLDNARRTDTIEPGWDLLLGELRRQAATGQLRLVVLSRALPDWARGGGWPGLGGLDDRAARRLLAASGLKIRDEQTWQVIYERTQGFPQLLRLVAAWALSPGGGHDLSELLDHSDIRAYLVSEICGALSPEAARLLRWACALRRPLDLDQPQAMAALADVGRRQVGLDALEELVGRGLLLQSRQRVYQPSALVREHVLNQGRADLSAWRRLHKRIARAHTQAGDEIEAAYHEAQAGAPPLIVPVAR